MHQSLPCSKELLGQRQFPPRRHAAAPTCRPVGTPKLQQHLERFSRVSRIPAAARGFAPPSGPRPMQKPTQVKDSVVAADLPQHRSMVESLALKTPSYPALAAWLRTNEQQVIRNPSTAVLALLRALELSTTLSELDKMADDEVSGCCSCRTPSRMQSCWFQWRILMVGQREQLLPVV